MKDKPKLYQAKINTEQRDKLKYIADRTYSTITKTLERLIDEGYTKQKDKQWVGLIKNVINIKKLNL